MRRAENGYQELWKNNKQSQVGAGKYGYFKRRNRKKGLARRRL